MGKYSNARREFLRRTILSIITLGGFSGNYSCSKSESPDVFGDSSALLGNTGIRIPRITLGLGSRFCSNDEETALEILNYALRNGLNSWDTAHSYQNIEKGIISEEIVGKILKDNRDDVFITTKIANRDPDVAMRQIEISLKRLQTSYIDNLMIHSVTNMDDVDLISKQGGIIDLLARMKHQGVAKFIGFSGHSDGSAMGSLIDRYDFNTMLIALNHYDESTDQRELVIPYAIRKGIGVLLMKAVRPKETVNDIKVADLIRYALSINGPTGIVLGMDSLDVVKSNIELLRSFIPMTSSEKNIISSKLTPFFNNTRLEWLREGYHDGDW